MKKLLLSCVMLVCFLLIPMSSFCSPANVQYTPSLNEKRVAKLYSSYIASLLASGCVGVTTGAVLRYLEKQLNIQTSPIAVFLVLLGWALESEFRNDIVASLQNDLDSYQIDHKKGLMFKGAWIASWLAYLQM